MSPCHTYPFRSLLFCLKCIPTHFSIITHLFHCSNLFSVDILYDLCKHEYLRSFCLIINSACHNYIKVLLLSSHWLWKGWLVGCFGFEWPFETVFRSILGRLPKRGRKKREIIDERKNVQTTPTRTYCKRSRPLPYSNPNKQDAPALEVYPAPSHHPRYGKKIYSK